MSDQHSVDLGTRLGRFRRAVLTVLRRGGVWIRSTFNLESSGETVLLSAIVGALAGLAASVFVFGLLWVSRLIVVDAMHYVPPVAGTAHALGPASTAVVPWAVLLFPTLGGLLAGFLVFVFCPEAEGHGSDAMVRSFHRLQGKVRARVPVVKGISSIITIGSGGSAGREGPIAQVAAGIGANLADLLKLSADQRRHLMLAGAAGGIAAVFQSPLGASLFVCEVLYSSTALETSALLFTTIASVTAYAVFAAIHGGGHEIIAAQSLKFGGLTELPVYAVFAIALAIAGYAYVKTFYGLRDHFFRRLPIPRLLRPALGGFLLGAMILLVRIPGDLENGIPHVIGGGYGWIQQALDGKLNVWWVLLLLAFAKMVATSLTISSGGSGGVFAPSLFVGAMLGGAFGWLGHQWFPGYVSNPQVFVLVGMGAFFAAVAKVPLTAVVMVCEMTGSFDLLAPLMFVSVLANALLSHKVSLYEEQVNSHVDSPAHYGDFLIDVLANLRVEQVYDPTREVCAIYVDTPLREIIRKVIRAETSYFPVVDKQERLVGIFTLSDLRSVMQGTMAPRLVLAADIAITPVITVTPEDDLHTALQRFTVKNVDELPIVALEDRTRVVGMLRRKELISAYDQEIERLRNEGNGEVAR